MKPIVSVVSTDMIVVRKQFSKSMFRVFLMLYGLVSGVGSIVFAYTAVTSNDPLLEQSFISATTNQFQATVITNPFFAGTFQVNLLGPNPNYNPPVTNLNLLNSLVTVDSYTYVAGWANGESYQQFQSVSLASDYVSLCANATNFVLTQTTTSTFDLGTCEDTLATFITSLQNLSASTPTVVPGNFQ